MLNIYYNNLLLEEKAFLLKLSIGMQKISITVTINLLIGLIYQFNWQSLTDNNF